ncbi:MAG: hypothetical protein WCS90_02875, partial [Bacilli bacterium]
MKTQKLILLTILPLFLTACGPTTISFSSSASTVQSSGDLQEKIVLNKDNAITYSGLEGSFSANGLNFKASRCDSATTGWITLQQGGYLTNTTAYGYSFSSVTVD